MDMKEKLILALDVADYSYAVELVDSFSPLCRDLQGGA